MKQNKYFVLYFNPVLVSHICICLANLIVNYLRTKKLGVYLGNIIYGKRLFVPHHVTRYRLFHNLVDKTLFSM